MKKYIIILLSIVLILTLTGCSKEEKNLAEEETKNVIQNSKGVILYFSATGTTEAVALKISNITKSDIIKIEPKEPYTSNDLNYNNNNSRANKEQNSSSSRPEIANEINIDKYDTIYIGYPIWWGTNPKIILTLIDTVNFKNKRIKLFCTSGSTGIEQSVSDIKNYNPLLNIIDGKRFTSGVSDNEIADWIKE